jgi:cobalt-zinc-cadmium efflux system outer membrane protein
MKHATNKHWLIALLLTAIHISQGIQIGIAQTTALLPKNHIAPIKESQRSPSEGSSLEQYVDPANGLSADEAVAYALTHNGELLAARKEIEIARALVKQASLRANPRLDVNGSRNVVGSDNNVTIAGMLPLELGRRRASRVAVAERELEMKERAASVREQMLAAEVRAKFGQALAEASKLGFAEKLLATTRRGYDLVAARVTAGRAAPLEQNLALVEINRIRSQRETYEGKVEVLLLELRNLIGMNPEEPLRLRGELASAIMPLPPLAESTARALRNRPEAQAARAAEHLAEAQIEQARASGRWDAGLVAQYQRMNSSFSVRGINQAGQLQPIQDIFHFFTFGLSIDLPVRNKNQGAIEAAVGEAEAMRQRREFVELTVRREVAAAYARYERAARAQEIFRLGVRLQATQNLELIRQTYELGAKPLLDYIAEQRRYIEVETGFIDALLDTYLARVEVERATASSELIKK